MCCVFDRLFLFKQKTAYEMRISDWSSDVCSSDLQKRGAGHGRPAPSVRSLPAPEVVESAAHREEDGDGEDGAEGRIGAALPPEQPCERQRGQAHRHRHGSTEEHTSELQSLMRNPYAVVRLQKNKQESTITARGQVQN